MSIIEYILNHKKVDAQLTFKTTEPQDNKNQRNFYVLCLELSMEPYTKHFHKTNKIFMSVALKDQNQQFLNSQKRQVEYSKVLSLYTYIQNYEGIKYLRVFV